MRRSTTLVLISAGIIFSLCLVSPRGNSSAGDTKVDEIIAKHLASIGAPEARTPSRSRLMIGLAKMTVRSRGNSEAAGSAVLASQAGKSMITMKFGVPDYPYEKVGFDGENVTAYALRPGVYSTLGSFVKTYTGILKEGLMGGTLSSAWPLLDLSSRKAKLEYAGTKKIESRPAVEIKYMPKGGSDLSISLFFDAETAQHVRTHYKKTVVAQLGATVDSSAKGSESRYELIEDFSDFRNENGLTLPHHYEIHYRYLGSDSRYFDWVMTLHRFLFDQPIDSRDFNVTN
jgi:hypothetical protein